MKKVLLNISLLSFAVLIVAALTTCTLNMEDWVETDEDKGYENLEKVENDFYELEYQFKEHTRSLTDNIQEYIVTIEADSIIYFLDNIPSEWIPEVGGCVVSNCCLNFPMGLIGRVLSVDKENGMIKVVTTPCNLEDAYEDFNLDLDMDVLSSSDENVKQVTRCAVPSTRAGGGCDSIIVTTDWTMFNLTSDQKVICRNGKATRADDGDDAIKEDTDKEITGDIEEVAILTFDEGNYPLKALVEKINSNVKEKHGDKAKIIDKLTVKLSSISQTNTKKVIRVKDDYEYTKQIVSSGYKVTVEAGRGTTVWAPKKSKAQKEAEREEEIMKGFEDFAKQMVEKGNAIVTDISDPEVPKEAIHDGRQVLAEIPLGNLPFGILIRIKPVLEFTVSLIGGAEFYFWTSKTQTESTIYQGNTKEKEPVALAKPSNSYIAYLQGGFKFSGGGELFIGFGKKFGAGARQAGYGVGGFIQGTLDLEGKFKMSGGYEDCINGSVESGLSLTGNIEFGGKVLAGNTFGDYKFLTKEKKVWDGFSYNFFPSVEVDQDIKMVIAKDSKGEYKQFKVTYKYNSIGFFESFNPSCYFPELRIYRGDNTDDSKGGYVDLAPDSKVDKIRTKKDYTFTYKIYEPEQDFTVVPMMRFQRNGTTNRTLFYDNKRYISKETLPIVELYPNKKSKTDYKDVVYQQYGDKADSEYLKKWAGVFAGSYYQYDFCLPFYMHNASSMPNVFSDFGIEYIINCGKKEISGSKSLMKKIRRSGLYAPRIQLITNLKGEGGMIILHSARLYYILKTEPGKKYYFDTPESWEHTTKNYINYKGGFKNEVLINSLIELVYPYEDTELYDWELKIDDKNYIDITAS